MAPQVVVRIASPAEAEALAAISQRSFDSDLALGADLAVGAPVGGGPPGYDDPAWQSRMMRVGDFYSLIVEGHLVGGAVVFEKGPGECELGRIFIDPTWHRRGIGSRAIALLMDLYPDADRWILDTPSWNPRTREFYEGLGFEEYGTLVLPGGFELVLFEKRLDRLF